MLSWHLLAWNLLFLIICFHSPTVKERLHGVLRSPVPMSDVITEKPRKVLLLGSGGLSIGQAGEFDYSGSQVIVLIYLTVVQSKNLNETVRVCGILRIYRTSAYRFAIILKSQS